MLHRWEMFGGLNGMAIRATLSPPIDRLSVDQLRRAWPIPIQPNRNRAAQRVWPFPPPGTPIDPLTSDWDMTFSSYMTMLSSLPHWCKPLHRRRGAPGGGV